LIIFVLQNIFVVVKVTGNVLRSSLFFELI